MNSALDSNSRQTITARLNTDGVTVIRIKATVNGRLEVVDDIIGSSVANNYAATDDNNRPTMFAVSSADGKTPIALQADSSGNLLIDSQ